MLASKNTIPPVTEHAEGVRYVKLCAGELHVRLQEFCVQSAGLWPKTLVLTHRTGIQRSRSRQTPFRYTSRLNTEYIAQSALKLWDGVYAEISQGGFRLNNVSLSMQEGRSRLTQQISLQFTDLERVELGQRRIAEFYTPSSIISPQSIESPQEAPPRNPSRTVAVEDTKRSENEFDPEIPSGSMSRPSGQHRLESIHDPKMPSTSVMDDFQYEDQSWTWTCPECAVVIDGRNEIDPDERFLAIINNRREHEDYHFALALQDRDRGDGDSRSMKVSPAKKRRKGKEPDDIRAFFERKTRKYG